MKIDENILPCKDNCIKAFTILRDADDSEGEYAGNNICDYTNDFPFHIIENRMELSHMLDIKMARILQPLQVHDTKVSIVDAQFMNCDLRTLVQYRLADTDALVTSLKGVLIGVNTADCVPILFYDPVKSIAGAAHAGWRGTAGNIACETIEAMKSLGALPENIWVGIGAAISKEAYEVGDEVVEELATTGLKIEDFASRNDKTGKYHVDLREANRLLLLACGINPQNIKVNSDCTYSDSHNYYSARRLGRNSGRIYTGIIIT